MRLTRRQALAVAVVCGLLAAVLSYIYLRRPSSEETTPEVVKVSVVQALVDLPTGARLAPTLVTAVSLNETEVPKRAILAGEDLSKTVEGLVAVVPIKAGEVLTEDKVRRPTSDLGLAFMVPEGMRAVTVAVDEVAGVGWLAKPGDHVDVLATFEYPEEVVLTRTILQNVEVLAIGTQMVVEEEPQPEAAEQPQTTEKAKSVSKQRTTATLAVTPQEVQKLILADTKGKLRLALRRAGDESSAALSSVRLSDVSGYTPKPKPEGPTAGPSTQQVQLPPWFQQPSQTTTVSSKPAGRPRDAVEVVRGGQREVIVP